MPRQVSDSEQGASRRIAFGTEAAGYDEHLYDASDPLKRRAEYLTSIDPSVTLVPEVPQDEIQDALLAPRPAAAGNITAPRAIVEEAEEAAQKLHDDDPFKVFKPRTVGDTETAYLARARKSGMLSDARSKPEEHPLHTMQETPREKSSQLVEVPNEDYPAIDPALSAKTAPLQAAAVISDVTGQPAKRQRRKRRWDVENSEPDPPPQNATTTSFELLAKPVPVPDAPPPTAPAAPTALETAYAKLSRWDAPVDSETSLQVMAHANVKKSRWDATHPVRGEENQNVAVTVLDSAVTPLTGSGLEHSAAAKSDWLLDLELRNKPFTDEELDDLLPSEGYTILEPPPGYQPAQNHLTRLLHTQANIHPPVYVMPAEGGMARESLGIPVEIPDSLKGISMKAEDYKHFAKILDTNAKQDDSTPEEQVERRIMHLLLKIKNGAPSVRKVAMRQISERAREFGAGPLVKQILPLLMSPTLEHQERHLYVKVIDRILYKLDELVRPFVHKILIVIEPMLIDDDYYARVEGREIISNLAKVVGLATMISTMRPDIDHQDEFVRNTTARAFAVVTSALGLPSMLLFLHAVCGSTKSWEARHTGIKIIQQVALLMGVAVLPHLNELVEIVEPGLYDEQPKVRLISAFALANLAEASAPYGIEAFERVLKPLWDGIRLHRGKTLAAFLKAIGFIIPLMDEEYANYYAREVNFILVREFQSSDEEMKSVVLKVVMQSLSCSGVEPQYVREEVAPAFFRCFWIHRIALDKRNFKAVVETSFHFAVKIGGADVLRRVADDLKDRSEPYRRMVVETVEEIAENLGLADVDHGLEARLIDGLLFAFQEQANLNDSTSALHALAIVVEKLSLRAKPYLAQIVGIIKWRLNDKSAKAREQAADLMSKIAPVMMKCKEDPLLAHMGTVLFEYLGEEFPDVLGSIIRAMKSIVEVIGVEDMQPPTAELLPRLTPILKNRHEKVQENCIILVGIIANKAARYVSPKEWMRICFELLELLKAPRKAIRKSAVATFGHIAKAIGPSNVLVTLLNNLKVQERTQRVCTTVAIAIVAETCQPYTVIPSLMGEYRIPELHVQNGILKSLSFLFEYIGPMAADYIYALTPLLEDALIDRDLVHRQTACSAVGHLALGVRGLGVEDALIHLLNHVWPNIFETSPHVINAVLFAIQGCAVALGPAPMLLYLLQGLFHPAKKVREVYWKVYNILYVYAQEGLVPFYPSLTTVDIVEDEEFGADRYERHELNMIL